MKPVSHSTTSLVLRFHIIHRLLIWEVLQVDSLKSLLCWQSYAEWITGRWAWLKGMNDRGHIKGFFVSLDSHAPTSWLPGNEQLSSDVPLHRHVSGLLQTGKQYSKPGDQQWTFPQVIAVITWQNTGLAVSGWPPALPIPPLLGDVQTASVQAATWWGEANFEAGIQAPSHSQESA